MTSQRLLSSTSFAVLAMASLPLAIAQAADLRAAPPPIFTQLPAVDGVNWKGEVFGGLSNLSSSNPYFYQGSTIPPAAPFVPFKRSRAKFGGAGSISTPLSNSFGLQIDTMLSSNGGHAAAGLGGHLFWRNPAVGLFGVYGSGTYFSQVGGIGLGRAAFEGEYYLGRFTIGGKVGGEFGRSSNINSLAFGGIGTQLFYAYSYYDLHTRLFDKVDISYYPLDNLKLSVGHRYTGGRNGAALGAEYLIPMSGGMAASLFADGTIGEKHTSSVRAGLRFYFGKSDKTLIRRHREDDPANDLPSDLNTLANSARSGVGLLPSLTTPSTPACTPCEGIVFGGKAVGAKKGAIACCTPE